MTQAKQITDEINSWVGGDQPQTEESISALIWAMAMDTDLTCKVFGEVGRQRARMSAEARQDTPRTPQDHF